MFERYTEKARRVIFFARYEASQYGSPNIETEHLLLGLLREDRALARLVLGGFGSGGAIRREIESQIQPHPRISTADEIPLSEESKRILNFAANEATKLSHAYIDTGHLLLAILREENCLAARVLAKQGAILSDLREKIADRAPADIRGFRPSAPSPRDVARVPFGTAVDQFLQAWAAHDVKMLASFFAPHGQLWDTRGELHLSPAQIEKTLAAHFACSEPTELAPDVRDIKFITDEVSAATLIWQPQGDAKKHNPAPLRMVLVLCHAYHGWQIVSAHLAFLDPSQEEENR